MERFKRVAEFFVNVSVALLGLATIGPLVWNFPVAALVVLLTVAAWLGSFFLLADALGDFAWMVLPLSAAVIYALVSMFIDGTLQLCLLMGVGFGFLLFFFGGGGSGGNRHEGAGSSGAAG